MSTHTIFHRLSGSTRPQVNTDKQQSLLALSLCLRIEMAVDGKGSPLAKMIEHAAKKTPGKALLREIAGSAADNWQSVANVLGARLTNDVVSFVNGSKI